MLRLYKIAPGRLLYWQARVAEGRLMVRQGEVGDPGTVQAMALVGDPETLIEMTAEPRLHEGYMMLDPSAHRRLIVQYPTSPADDPQGERATEMIAACLFETGNGHCEGATPGSPFNIVAHVVDAPRAAASVLGALMVGGAFEDATVAFLTREGWVVDWPPVFEGTFSESA